MPKGVIISQFGLRLSGANVGLLPVNPRKRAQQSVRFVGSMYGGNGPTHRFSNIPIGPSTPNRMLVAIPSAFFNSASHSIEAVTFNGRQAIILEGGYTDSGQQVVTGLCYLPFAYAAERVTVDVKFDASAGIAVAMGLYVVNCKSAKPVATANVAGTGSRTAHLKRGAIGLFCTGSGSPEGLTNIEGGVVDFPHAETGRITTCGRIDDTRQPLTITSNGSDPWRLLAASWD